MTMYFIHFILHNNLKDTFTERLMISIMRLFFSWEQSFSFLFLIHTIPLWHFYSKHNYHIFIFMCSLASIFFFLYTIHDLIGCSLCVTLLVVFQNLYWRIQCLMWSSKGTKYIYLAMKDGVLSLVWKMCW